MASAAFLAMPAVAGHEDFKSDNFPLEKNLAFDLDAPGAVAGPWASLFAACARVEI